MNVRNSAGVVLLTLAGCASTASAPRGDAFAADLDLLRPMRGRYTIVREGERVGEEQFAVTSSAGVWQVRGEISLSWPADSKQHYLLRVDRARREPLGFEVGFELAGERQTARGDCDGDYLNVHTENMLGVTDSRVAYARGTMLDFGSPLFNTVALALLGPHLEERKPIAVRAIVLAMPFLLPAVMVQKYTLMGLDGELRKVAVGPATPSEEQLPTALWVRADGLPVRIRTWPEGGGSPLELQLEPEIEAESATKEGPR